MPAFFLWVHTSTGEAIVLCEEADAGIHSIAADPLPCLEGEEPRLSLRATNLVGYLDPRMTHRLREEERHTGFGDSCQGLQQIAGGGLCSPSPDPGHVGSSKRVSALGLRRKRVGAHWPGRGGGALRLGRPSCQSGGLQRGSWLLGWLPHAGTLCVRAGVAILGMWFWDEGCSLHREGCAALIVLLWGAVVLSDGF